MISDAKKDVINAIGKENKLIIFITSLLNHICDHPMEAEMKHFNSKTDNEYS
jgi:hypothetical protein